MRVGIGPLIGALSALYFGLPFVIWQWANWGVLRRGSGARPEAALTFDDGPDPETTPLVLDALERAGVRGTFFLLGQKALIYPDLTREIAARGHEIGCHGFRHRHAFLRTPWGVALDMERGVAAIERVTATRPRLFRPAHGAYTLATPLALKALRLVPVHWTIEAHDWMPGFTPDRVRARVLAAMEPGAVVVLHDAGRGARNTAAALPALLDALRARGYNLVPVGALTNARTGTTRDVALRVWQSVEHLFDRSLEMDALTEHADSVFRVARTRYAGPPLSLPDGSQILPGDPAAEIHLHSARLQAAASDNPRAALRLLRHSMYDLARFVQDEPKYRDVRILFGIYLRPGLFEPLGCTITPLPIARPYLTRYMRFLRRLYGSGRARAPLEPKLVWMDRHTFLARYGS